MVGQALLTPKAPLNFYQEANSYVYINYTTNIQYFN